MQKYFFVFLTITNPTVWMESWRSQSSMIFWQMQSIQQTDSTRWSDFAVTHRWWSSVTTIIISSWCSWCLQLFVHGMRLANGHEFSVFCRSHLPVHINISMLPGITSKLLSSTSFRIIFRRGQSKENEAKCPLDATAPVTFTLSY